MPGVEEGLLPHARTLQDAAQLEEERRVCYVGMTRAQERLYLLRARTRFSPWENAVELSAPSRFLEAVPAGGIVRLSDAGQNEPATRAGTAPEQRRRFEPGESGPACALRRRIRGDLLGHLHDRGRSPAAVERSS